MGSITLVKTTSSLEQKRLWTYSMKGLGLTIRLKRISRQQEKEADEVKPKKLFVQKYHDKSAPNVLYEAVLIAGKPYFVSQGWDVNFRNPIARLYDEIPIPDAQEPTMELLPP